MLMMIMLIMIMLIMKIEKTMILTRVWSSQCTNVIQFFSVENMGHNQLRKCSKYHLVSLLNEKQRSTFANFLHLFYPCPLLTNSAMEGFQPHVIFRHSIELNSIN